ncbi:MAG: hypothetical protein EPN23_05330 [Verrucomicrobia bacterium]|nr:MAG: hypothetical protein EPN23_05330 [Verrucomicrobiota bacterium]
MNNEKHTLLQPEVIRKVLQSFWNDVLEITITKSGVALAVPLCYPDGWQVVLEFQQLTPGYFRVSDHGRTLHWLVGTGQNVESSAVSHVLSERMKAFQLQRDGWELFREIHFPLTGVDIQLFAEGLVSIAHLFYLYEPSPKTLNVAQETVAKVFQEHKITPQRGLKLNGHIEKQIRVDFYADIAHPVALEVVSRRTNLVSYMEQWGFRWGDLCDSIPNLLPAMVFDPDNTEMDPTSRSIGESVCKLFCPYVETDRIHNFLLQATTNHN